MKLEIITELGVKFHFKFQLSRHRNYSVYGIVSDEIVTVSNVLFVIYVFRKFSFQLVKSLYDIFYWIVSYEKFAHITYNTIPSKRYNIIL